MTGYSLSGSVLISARSSTAISASPEAESSLFFPLLLLPPVPPWSAVDEFALRSRISRSALSTSSSAFRKSFCPPTRSCPFSSMSSSARRRRRRSLSDSPKSRIGWPLPRRRRMVSSLEMLKATLAFAFEGGGGVHPAAPPSGTGEAVEWALGKEGVKDTERLVFSVF
jgi:hypothetical protein